MSAHDHVHQTTGLMRSLDGYCERVGPEYWAEPINALTNLAFVIAAAILWRRCRGMITGRVLCVLLALIGVGSWLFHTHAQVWSAIADVVPIGVFVLAYVFVATRDFLGQPPVRAAATAALFLPFATITLPVFQALPFFQISAAYWPVALLIALYAVGLRRRAPATARGLGIGAGLLGLSLMFRSLDMPLCGAIPLGTHFLWHIINGILLGWMIEVWRRHMVASAAHRV